MFIKIFNAHAVETRKIDFMVVARTKQEAAKRVANILDTPDLIDNMNVKSSIAFQLSENEDSCPYDDEEECLFDELY